MLCDLVLVPVFICLFCNRASVCSFVIAFAYQCFHSTESLRIIHSLMYFLFITLKPEH